MTFGVLRGLVVDDEGNVQTNVYIEVRREPLHGLAIPLYAQPDASATVDWPDGTMDNPFLSVTGEYETYAVGGTYQVRAYKSGYEKILSNVPVGTAQGSDVDNYASAGFTFAPESAITTPPNTGCVRFDTADVTLAGHVYLSATTLGGSDITSWITSLKIADWLLLSTGVGVEVGWPVLTITNHTTWFDIALDTANFSGPVGPLSFGDVGFVTAAQQRAGSATAGSTTYKTTTGSVAVGSTTRNLIINKSAPDPTAVTLPAVASRPSALPLTIADFNGNGSDVTITPNGSETIEGYPNWTLGAGSGPITLVPDTTLGGWYRS